MENLGKYFLANNGRNYIEPYYIAVIARGFSQQVSPNYLRRGNAIRWAKKHNIELINA